MEQVFYLPLPCPFFHVDLERILILNAIRTSKKYSPLGPLGSAHEFDQPCPLILFWTDKENAPVLALVHAPWIHIALPQARGDAAQVAVVHNRLLKERGNERLHGEIDMLAYSSRKRMRVSSKGGGSSSKSALEITLLTECFEWREIWAIGRTGTQPRPATRMRQGQFIRMVVLVRPSQPKRRN